MPEPLPLGSESLRIRAARRRRRQDRTAITLLLLLAVAVFSGGITWGLPSRQADRFLFGDRAAWSGERIIELTGERARDPLLGADVDRDPLTNRDGKVLLNETDRQRAEIVRRYRLFSYQPDEMVTLMALAQMRPGQGDLDPRLYQYGGLWIYPIGALLRIGSTLRLVKLTPDLAYYLDEPEAFGRFYVVARLYVVAWAVAGAWAVFALTRRLSGGSMLAACIACFCYIMMPVVVNMAHEAKPHLPGAVLMLLTLLAAVRYVRTADAVWWLLASVLAGLAVGMVLAAWPILIVLPLATLLLRQEWTSRLRTCAWGLALSIVTYFVTNPYVLIHLFGNRELLASNLGNTRAMFTFGLSMEGMNDAIRLLVDGASPTLIGLGAAGCLALVVAVAFRRPWATRYAGLLLLAPAVLVLIQFVLFAAGQPAEYTRFALFASIVLMMAAVVGGYLLFQWLEWRPEVLIILGLAAAMPGSGYYAGFAHDAAGPTSRTLAARRIEAKRTPGAALGVLAEPAPYAVPPVNLFDGPVVLLPEDYDPRTDPQPPDIVVWAIDQPVQPSDRWVGHYDWEFVDPVGATAPMRWSAKPFIILSRRAG